ncbi:hypothetical protein DFH06DRAFT_1340445 [Mycena polygramma]|nr:hypothetical protein DFH06DRAFT_1340445 [Mycena polygramma]
MSSKQTRRLRFAESAQSTSRRPSPRPPDTDPRAQKTNPGPPHAQAAVRPRVPHRARRASARTARAPRAVRWTATRQVSRVGLKCRGLPDEPRRRRSRVCTHNDGDDETRESGPRESSDNSAGVLSGSDQAPRVAPAARRRRSSPSRIVKPQIPRKIVRAVYDFSGSSDELAFKTGDTIVVGLFPTVHGGGPRLGLGCERALRAPHDRGVAVPQRPVRRVANEDDDERELMSSYDRPVPPARRSTSQLLGAFSTKKGH